MSRPSFLMLATLLALGAVAVTLPAAQAQTCPIGAAGCNGNGGGGGGGSGGGGGGSGGPGSGDDDWLKIACRVAALPAGSAETVSDDLRFRNIGSVPIPPHTPILWQVKQLNQSGTLALTRELLPGEDIDAQDVLSAGLPPDTRCLVRVG